MALIPFPVDNDFTKGLVGYWPLNDAGGSLAFDRSGFNANATLTNGPTWTSDNYGLSVSLDGVDDCLITSTIGHNIGTGDFTFCAWIKVRAGSVHQGLASNWGIIGNGDYSPVFGVGDGTNTIPINNLMMYWGGFFDFGAELKQGEWTHVAMIRLSSVVSAYINGVVCPNTTSMSTSMANAQQAIGRSGVAYTADPFPGNIKDVRVYKRALSAGELHGITIDSRQLFNGNPRLIYSVASAGAVISSTALFVAALLSANSAKTSASSATLLSHCFGAFQSAKTSISESAIVAAISSALDAIQVAGGTIIGGFVSVSQAIINAASAKTSESNNQLSAWATGQSESAKTSLSSAAIISGIITALEAVQIGAGVIVGGFVSAASSLSSLTSLKTSASSAELFSDCLGALQSAKTNVSDSASTAIFRLVSIVSSKLGSASSAYRTYLVQSEARLIAVQSENRNYIVGV